MDFLTRYDSPIRTFFVLVNGSDCAPVRGRGSGSFPMLVRSRPGSLRRSLRLSWTPTTATLPVITSRLVHGRVDTLHPTFRRSSSILRHPCRRGEVPVGHPPSQVLVDTKDDRFPPLSSPVMSVDDHSDWSPVHPPNIR